VVTEEGREPLSLQFCQSLGKSKILVGTSLPCFDWDAGKGGPSATTPTHTGQGLPP
jgi:hypothetical protein